MSNCRARFQIGAGVVIALAVVTLMVGSGYSQTADTHVIANSTPLFVANAQNLGPEDSSKQMEVTLWLSQHNKAALDSLVRDMYDKTSSSYHHWLTLNQYKASFAPSAQDAATVREFLASHNLTVTAVEKNNHFVTATGRIADVQNAFGVQINKFQYNGRQFRANTSDASIEGAAGAVVTAVQGLSQGVFQPHIKMVVNPDTGKAYPPTPLATGAPDGLFFSANCFRNPQTVTFKTPGGGPYAVYSGNRYGANITNSPPNLPPCGYDANDMQKAYGLKEIYQNGWKGKGQTVVIVDAYGSPTITDDANTFSSINNLPALTSTNFQIYNVGGTSTCTPAEGCSAPDWYPETTLDVEWSHSIAPQANIALIETTDNTNTNLDLGVLYAIDNLLGNVISNSYGSPEIETPPSELIVENTLNELGAALGISVDFSSGDDGDFYFASGGTFTSVSVPASSPYATAVGGTSMFLNSDKSINFQTGWGNNETRVALAETAPPAFGAPVIPPLDLGFIYGSGGGTSAYFRKPSFQKSLKGAWRKVPDISMDADPYTGVEIIITPDAVPGDPQAVEVYGGTSLSCPMFSALWAIANQAAAKPLGQAAPYLYELPPGDIADILQISSPFDVTGIIFAPPAAPQVETAADLVPPLFSTKKFVSALYNGTSTRWYVLSFGTDSSLVTGPGWDDVTGLGTPNGLSFIQGVVADSRP